MFETWESGFNVSEVVVVDVGWILGLSIEVNELLGLRIGGRWWLLDDIDIALLETTDDAEGDDDGNEWRAASVLLPEASSSSRDITTARGSSEKATILRKDTVEEDILLG